MLEQYVGYNLLVNALKIFCFILDLTQLIKDPTRICESCQSIIDLILVSDVQKICQQGVIECGMSDHTLFQKGLQIATSQWS